MRTLNSGLRTVDVARRTGYSVQQIRNLERDGALPAAARTPAGYRIHHQTHTQAALAYRELAAAVDPVEAKRIMRAVHRGPVSALLSLLEAANARLHAEREGLRFARQAASDIVEEPLDKPCPADSMTISELANALGIRPSTLRHWEAEGLLAPTRSAPQRVRTYSPRDVRDARVVHQLRQAGYRILDLKDLMPQLREPRGRDAVSRALAAREASLNSRSRHLVRGTAALDALLDGRQAGMTPNPTSLPSTSR